MVQPYCCPVPCFLALLRRFAALMPQRVCPNFPRCRAQLQSNLGSDQLSGIREPAWGNEQREPEELRTRQRQLQSPHSEFQISGQGSGTASNAGDEPHSQWTFVTSCVIPLGANSEHLLLPALLLLGMLPSMITPSCHGTESSLSSKVSFSDSCELSSSSREPIWTLDLGTHPVLTCSDWA